MIDPELKKEFKRLRKRQSAQFLMLVLLIGLAFLYMVTGPVHAQTITITNSAGGSLRDINVYSPNATSGQMDYVGRYNTTSVITTNGSASYTFDMVPMEANPLTDPADWLNNQAFPFVQTNITALVGLCFLIGLIFYGAKGR